MNKDRPTPEEFLKNYKISLGLNRLDKLVDARVKNVMEEYAIQQDAINKDRIIEILKEKLSNRGLYQDHLISDQKLLDEIATAIQQESGWVKVNKKPIPRVPVLVCVKDGKDRHHILRACWIPKHFEEDDGNYQGDADYLEEKDTFYWPKGWYEWNDCEETHWMIHYTVTHWMSLPPKPTEI